MKNAPIQTPISSKYLKNQNPFCKLARKSFEDFTPNVIKVNTAKKIAVANPIR